VATGVARICCEKGQRWKLCHGALTADFRAWCGYAAARWLIILTNVVLIERHLHNLADPTQYLDIWLSDLLQNELKMKSLKVEGHVPQCPIAGDVTACRLAELEILEFTSAAATHHITCVYGRGLLRQIHSNPSQLQPTCTCRAIADNQRNECYFHDNSETLSYINRLFNMQSQCS